MRPSEINFGALNSAGMNVCCVMPLTQSFGGLIDFIEVNVCRISGQANSFS